MNVIILAAGRGFRLKPLTDYKPKCLVGVSGKPIIRHTIDNIYEEILNPKIYIIVNYRMDVILDYVKKEDLNVMFIIQDKIDGTANAIYKAKPNIKGDFMVLSGDVIYSRKDIQKLSKPINCLLYTKQNERLQEYGTLNMDKEHILHINEKLTKPTSNLINCGAYHFTKDVFDYIENTPIDKRFNEKIITNTINQMIDDGIHFRGIYIDNLNEISYPEDIQKVEARL